MLFAIICVQRIFHYVTVIMSWAALSCLAVVAALTMFGQQQTNTVGLCIMVEFGFVTGMIALILVASGGMRVPEELPVR